jgi:hypothetical protein
MFKFVSAAVLIFALSTQLIFAIPLAIPGDTLALKWGKQLLYTYVCVSPAGELQGGGSSFPIDPTHLLTAAHMDCGPDNFSLVDTHRGYYTEVAIIRQNIELDIMLVEIINPSEVMPGPFAHFRAPQLGETVIGYGSAFWGEVEGGFFMQGVIQGISQYIVLSSCNIAPGMSGSALIGEDGAVVGLSIYARPTFLVGGFPWGVVAGATPSGAILALLAG